MKIVAFLPTKGTSERIPSKNLKLLDGKPLFMHTLEKLCYCNFLDEIYLDSESDVILNYARYLRYIPFKRDSELASNNTDGHELFYNEISKVDADIYVQILGTSPFIKPETIQKGINILINNSEYDSVVLVKKEKQYAWLNGQPSYDINKIPNSKDLPDSIIETMGLYIVRKNAACSLRKRIGNHPYLLEAEPIEAVDVNFPLDFVLAEQIAKGLRMNRIKKYRILAKHLNSSLFADILDSYNGNHIISTLRPNIGTTKILGVANTLKIRTLQDGEDYRGIYEPLKTYEKNAEGDIIMVENECSHRAYFGELNANLAIRAGALGAIIGGVTRDAIEVEALGFPVFSKGYCCADVRGKATMESYNQTITIDGVVISPGDLVFADVNGIAVIPKQLETEIISQVLSSIDKEKSILSKIVDDTTDAYQIYKEEGEF